MLQSNLKENVMKYKLAYTGLILLIYTLGKSIPLYGIDISAYTYESASVEEVLMQTIGGDAYRSSVFALGIFPIMISGILAQIFMAVKKLFSRSKISPKTMRRITVIVTFVIAIFQALLQVQELKFVVEGEMLFSIRLIAVIQMVTGVMIIMWFSKRNEKYGIGGRMILGLANILERITATFVNHTIDDLAIPVAISMIVMVITLVMENTEKRIPVQRISIHNIYADKNYMAIKLNPVGVMPVMFSTAVFMLPQMFIFLLGYLFPFHEGIIWWQMNMTLLKPLGIVTYIVCVYLLTIGFSMLMLSPKDIMEQFLKSGDSIVNLHAGRDTRKYLRRVVWRMSFLSATIMSTCVVVPLIMQWRGNIDSTLTMLPSSVMMLTGFWCTIFRELVSIHKYDTCQPLF